MENKLLEILDEEVTKLNSELLQINDNIDLATQGIIESEAYESLKKDRDQLQEELEKLGEGNFHEKSEYLEDLKKVEQEMKKIEEETIEEYEQELTEKAKEKSTIEKEKSLLNEYIEQKAEFDRNEEKRRERLDSLRKDREQLISELSKFENRTYITKPSELIELENDLEKVNSETNAISLENMEEQNKLLDLESEIQPLYEKYNIKDIEEKDPPKNEPPKNEPPENKPPENKPPENKPPKNEPPENKPPKNEPPENKPPKNEPPIDEKLKARIDFAKTLIKALEKKDPELKTLSSRVESIAIRNRLEKYLESNGELFTKYIEENFMPDGDNGIYTDKGVTNVSKHLKMLDIMTKENPDGKDYIKEFLKMPEIATMMDNMEESIRKMLEQNKKSKGSQGKQPEPPKSKPINEGGNKDINPKFKIDIGIDGVKISMDGKNIENCSAEDLKKYRWKEEEIQEWLPDIKNAIDLKIVDSDLLVAFSSLYYNGNISRENIIEMCNQYSKVVKDGRKEDVEKFKKMVDINYDRKDLDYVKVTNIIKRFKNRDRIQDLRDNASLAEMEGFASVTPDQPGKIRQFVGQIKNIGRKALGLIERKPKLLNESNPKNLTDDQKALKEASKAYYKGKLDYKEEYKYTPNSKTFRQKRNEFFAEIIKTDDEVEKEKAKRKANKERIRAWTEPEYTKWGVRIDHDNPDAEIEENDSKGNDR